MRLLLTSVSNEGINTRLDAVRAMEVFMDDKNWRKYIDPEDMTPDEIYARLVELLASGVLKLVKEEEKKVSQANLVEDENKESSASLPISNQPEILSVPIRGRTPFGLKVVNDGTTINEAEYFWIKKIYELHGQGLSSEKIARLLNVEDLKSKRACKWSRTAVWRILKKFSGFPPARE